MAVHFCVGRTNCTCAEVDAAFHKDTAKTCNRPVVAFTVSGRVIEVNVLLGFKAAVYSKM
jgi:hypothetical protein